MVVVAGVMVVMGGGNGGGGGRVDGGGNGGGGRRVDGGGNGGGDGRVDGGGNGGGGGRVDGGGNGGGGGRRGVLLDVPDAYWKYCETFHLGFLHLRPLWTKIPFPGARVSVSADGLSDEGHRYYFLGKIKWNFTLVSIIPPVYSTTILAMKLSRKQKLPRKRKLVEEAETAEEEACRVSRILLLNKAITK